MSYYEKKNYILDEVACKHAMHGHCAWIVVIWSSRCRRLIISHIKHHASKTTQIVDTDYKPCDLGKFTVAAVVQATQACVNTLDLKAVQITATEADIHYKMCKAVQITVTEARNNTQVKLTNPWKIITNMTIEDAQ